MLRRFAMVFQAFFRFFSSVSEAYFKCLNGLQADVASVASEYFKSKSSVKSQKNIDQVFDVECTWEVGGGARSLVAHG
jgi:hypothetical protein